MRGDPIRKYLLIRHGETEYNRQNRFYGAIDATLNATGEAQAKAAGERLASHQICHVFASPAKRAWHTAEIINERWQAPMSAAPQLWEISQGAWEGLTPDEIAAQDPGDWRRWLNGELSAPTSGESLEAATARVTSWLTSLDGSHLNEKVAVVAHGGILQIMLCELLGTPTRNLWPYRFGNTTAAEVWQYELGAVLVSFA